MLTPWDECICGHAYAEHDPDHDQPGCLIDGCPCPWFDHQPSCTACGLVYGCACPAVAA